eukprot:scaffold7759_cov119-Isochrysis_galbana.AAC.11
MWGNARPQGGPARATASPRSCLRLEESRDAVVLRLRDGGEQVGGGCEVAADDGRLVLEHRQQQLRRPRRGVKGQSVQWA